MNDLPTVYIWITIASTVMVGIAVWKEYRRIPPSLAAGAAVFLFMALGPSLLSPTN